MMESALVLVVGAGRSGTSSFAGVMNHLGFVVPAPVVGADVTNPRGHFEPLWAVEFHKKILAEAGCRTVDGDPHVGVRTMETARAGAFKDELAEWLSMQFRSAQQVVVKDPRTVWVAPVWMEVARELGIRVVIVTMLRHPADVVGSHTHHYSDWKAAEQQVRGETALLGGWINVNLVAEEVSRGQNRHVIVYEDLLDDWRSVLAPLRSGSGLPVDLSTDSEVAGGVDEFIDPDLHRVRSGWESSQIPVSLRAIADALWVVFAARSRGEIDEDTFVAKVAVQRGDYKSLFRASDMISRDRRLRAVNEAQRVGYQTALQDIVRHIDTMR